MRRLGLVAISVLAALLVLIPIALLRDWKADKPAGKQPDVGEQLRAPNDEIGRERYAGELAKRLSASWRSVKIHASGPKNTTLHMDDILLNPSSINDLVRDGKFVEEARAMGFKHLRFTDGFGNTWSRSIRAAK